MPTSLVIINACSYHFCQLYFKVKAFLGTTIFYSTVQLPLSNSLKQICRRWTVPVRLADCCGAAPEHDQGNILWNREASQPLC